MYESNTEIPSEINSMILNSEIGLVLLKLVEIIGEDELENLDIESIYYIVTILNEIQLIDLRNEVLLKEGDEIKLSKGERHRIIGTDDYSVVAEIWIHTDKGNPSDEDDIVRIKDDFNRN